MDRQKGLIIICFFFIYVVWGSTYLMLAYVIEEIPPFLTASLRFGLASLILFFLALSSRHFHNIKRKEVINSFIAGVLMLGLGSGITSWVLQFLDSGFTALVISALPLMIVLLMWVVDKQRPSNEVFLGVFLGIIGIYLLVGQKGIVTNPDQWMAVAALFVCMVAWAGGSIFIGKAVMPQSYLVNTMIQFAAGVVVTLILSLITEDIAGVNWSQISALTWYLLLYLAVFGSVIAFLSFTYLLKTVSPDKVSTSTYVNPVIALALGWWFRDELVTTQSIVAACIMLTGVILINFRLQAMKKGIYLFIPKRLKRKRRQ